MCAHKTLNKQRKYQGPFGLRWGACFNDVHGIGHLRDSGAMASLDKGSSFWGTEEGFQGQVQSPL